MSKSHSDWQFTLWNQHSRKKMFLIASNFLYCVKLCDEDFLSPCFLSPLKKQPISFFSFTACQLERFSSLHPATILYCTYQMDFPAVTWWLRDQFTNRTGRICLVSFHILWKRNNFLKKQAASLRSTQQRNRFLLPPESVTASSLAHLKTAPRAQRSSRSWSVGDSCLIACWVSG